MTPEERQQLRDWSARDLMGFHLKWEIQGFTGRKRWYYIVDNAGHQITKESWAPDLPTTTASQILGVIEKMRELGLGLVLVWVFGSNKPGETSGGFSASFFQHNGIEKDGGAYADNPLDAILKAAYEAVKDGSHVNS